MGRRGQPGSRVRRWSSETDTPVQVPPARIRHPAGESRAEDRAARRNGLWTASSFLEKAPPGRGAPSGRARPRWPDGRGSHKEPRAEAPDRPPRRPLLAPVSTN